MFSCTIIDHCCVVRYIYLNINNKRFCKELLKDAVHFAKSRNLENHSIQRGKKCMAYSYSDITKCNGTDRGNRCLSKHRRRLQTDLWTWNATHVCLYTKASYMHLSVHIHGVYTIVTYIFLFSWKANISLFLNYILYSFSWNICFNHFVSLWSMNCGAENVFKNFLVKCANE